MFRGIEAAPRPLIDHVALSVGAEGDDHGELLAATAGLAGRRARGRPICCWPEVAAYGRLRVDNSCPSLGTWRRTAVHRRGADFLRCQIPAFANSASAR